MSEFRGPLDTSTVQMSNGGFVTPTSFGYYPPEGSRVATTRYNFASLASYYEDLSYTKALGMETNIQSVYIDNSNNNQAVTLQVMGSNQFITCPAYTILLSPAFFTDNPSCTVSVTSASAGYTRVHFLNVPMGGATSWNVGTPASSSVDGNGNPMPVLIGTSPFVVGVTNTATTIIPAVAGKSYFLSAINISVDPNATLAVAGQTVLTIHDTVQGNLFAVAIYLGTTAITQTIPLNFLQMSGLQFVSAPLSSLVANLTTSLATPGIRVSVFGGYTTLNV